MWGEVATASQLSEMTASTRRSATRRRLRNPDEAGLVGAPIQPGTAAEDRGGDEGPGAGAAGVGNGDGAATIQWPSLRSYPPLLARHRKFEELVQKSGSGARPLPSPLWRLLPEKLDYGLLAAPAKVDGACSNSTGTNSPFSPKPPHFQARAKAVISLFHKKHLLQS